MMNARVCLVAAVACASAVAHAQPAPAADHACRVVIALAPDDVRAEIEAWVRAEPQCRVDLEVRVIPTADGLYLNARDSQGHVRERVVPDAQSVAVLVVSWMADDSMGSSFPTHGKASAAADFEVPSEVAQRNARGFASPTFADAAARRLSLGIVGAAHSGPGLRAQIDVLAGSTWTLGIIGGWRDRRYDVIEGQLRLAVAARHTLGRLTFGAQLGAGININSEGDIAQARADLMTTVREPRAVEPAIEGSVFANVRITDGWGVVGGPIVQATPHSNPMAGVFLGAERKL